MESRGK